LKIKRKTAAAVLPGAGKSVFRKKVSGKTRGEKRGRWRGKTAARLLWSLQCKFSQSQHCARLPKKVLQCLVSRIFFVCVDASRKSFAGTVKAALPSKAGGAARAARSSHASPLCKFIR